MGGLKSRPDESAGTTAMVTVDPLGDSFGAFYQAEVDRLYRALTLAVGSSDLATEAIDEAMARAFQQWPTVRTMNNPQGWVYRVGLNWSISRLRKNNRERLGENWQLDRSSHDSVVDIDLHRALGKLSVKARSIVVLRHLLGWSTAETAEALRMRPGTVKSNLSRALEQLRYDLERP